VFLGCWLSNETAEVAVIADISGVEGRLVSMDYDHGGRRMSCYQHVSSTRSVKWLRVPYITLHSIHYSTADCHNASLLCKLAQRMASCEVATILGYWRFGRLLEIYSTG
jgi:hypothetical protein